MRTARITHTGKICTAQEFKGLTPDQQAELRGGLECPDCGAAAHYKQPGKRRRKPHFGARDHARTCPQGTIRSGGISSDEVVSVGTVDATILRIRLMEPPTDGVQSEWLDDPTQDGGGTHVSRVARNGAVQKSTNLGGLLHRVSTIEGYSRSAQVIETVDGRLTTVNEYCVDYSISTSDAHIGHEGFYWGVVIKARSPFVYTASRSPQLIFEQNALAVALERAGLTEAESWGHWFGVIGTPRAHDKSRMEIVVSHPSRIAFGGLRFETE